MNGFTPGETRAVWKYGLPTPGTSGTYEVPGPARIVHFAKPEHGQASVWIEVWPGYDAHTTTFKLSVVGTGWPYDSGTHLGTYIDGEFVWHVLDVS